MAARLAAELVMEIRCQLRMLGVQVDGPAMMYGDNNSVVLNCTTPSSVLKKKHLSLSCHRVREACAAGILVFKCVKSEDNFADLLTKPLGGLEFCKLIKPHLFRNPKCES